MRNFFTLVLLAVTFISVAHATPLPRPDHVVVIIEENHSYAQIMDKRNSASYIQALAKRGVLFTESYAVSHPSQPNYLALFSGSTQGVTNDGCLRSFANDNLASALIDGGFSFATFSESLPKVGDLSCGSGAYQRKHNPAANWQGTRLPAELNKRFADFSKLSLEDFSKLPTVSFVIPNLDNDMHDGSFEMADDWLKKRIEPYVTWAMKHNSLLILTWDEDDHNEGNHIASLLVGPMVNAGTTSAQRIDHYSVLRTLLDFYGLPALGASRDAAAMQNIWK